MLTIGINICAQGVTALTSDIVFGPPGPVTCSLFVRSLLRSVSGDEDPANIKVRSVAIGMRTWSIDCPDHKDYGGTIKWSPRRHTFDPVKCSSGLVAIMDSPLANIDLTLAVSLDADSGLGDELVRGMNEILPATKFCGGVIDTRRSSVKIANSLRDLLRGSYLMYDKTERIREISEKFNLDPMRVLIDIVHREALSDEQKKLLEDLQQSFGDLGISPYQAELHELRYVCPVPIGYRLISDLTTKRKGRRRDLAHAFAETVTGLAGYESVGGLDESFIRKNAWTAMSSPEIIYYLGKSND